MATDGSGVSATDGARSAVTPAEIVAAALQIIDDEGFAALSMRRVAGSLGVFPATLYWHVGNRAQLLGLVCETVLSSIELPGEDVPWTEWLFAFGARIRRVIGAHPRFAGYFVTNIQASASSLAIAEAVLGTLRRAGFAGNDLIQAYNAVQGVVFGWVSGEFADGSSDRGDSDQTFIESNVADDPALSTIRENWPLAANRAFMLRWDSGTASPLESSYEFMLNALIDGLARRAPRLA